MNKAAWLCPGRKRTSRMVFPEFRISKEPWTVKGTLDAWRL